VIDFRYHIVSIVAVFLALALGLFIGSTSLRPTVAHNLKQSVDSVTAKNRTLSGQLSDTRNQLSKEQAFESALEPYAVAGRLTGQTVVVVSAPGADGAVRDDVERALGEAGATLAADVRLTDTLFDPQQDSFLGTLADRVTVSGVTLPGGTGAQRALALLADVLGERPQGQPLAPSAIGKVVSAYTAGKLVSVSGPSPRPGSLAVLITGVPATSGDAQAAAAREALVADFARDLDQAAVGAVATGPTTAADAGGLLAVIRSQKQLRGAISTVDGAELPRGVIATVIALAEQADGKVGSYGGGAGADSPLPSASPSAP
jgi:hypothetical protein